MNFNLGDIIEVFENEKPCKIVGIWKNRLSNRKSYLVLGQFSNAYKGKYFSSISSPGKNLGNYLCEETYLPNIEEGYVCWITESQAICLVCYKGQVCISCKEKAEHQGPNVNNNTAFLCSFCSILKDISDIRV